MSNVKGYSAFDGHREKAEREARLVKAEALAREKLANEYDEHVRLGRIDARKENRFDFIEMRAKAAAAMALEDADNELVGLSAEQAAIMDPFGRYQCEAEVRDALAKRS